MQEPSGKTINVYGDKFARAKNTVPAYQRHVSTRPVTFTCTVCKQQVIRECWPGPAPRYCSDGCRDEREAQRNEERVRKQREKRRAQSALKKSDNV